MFTLSTTEKNKPLLLSKGFCYTIDKTNNDKIYWKCEYARKLKCKGRIHTNDIKTTILHENDNHNHPGNAISSEIRLFEEKVRDRAVNCNENTQTVLDNCLTDLSDLAVARIPNFKHIKRNIQHRRVMNDFPKIPNDRTFNQIPDILTVTKRNNEFLQFDSCPDDRILCILNFFALICLFLAINLFCVSLLDQNDYCYFILVLETELIHLIKTILFS